MSKFVILVEGKCDIVFLRDYLFYLYNDLQIIKDEKKEKIFKFNDTIIKISAVGGYTAITKHLNVLFQEIKDFNNRIIIIQDADSSDNENGGVKNRRKYLNDVKKNLELDFETFLFPNNKDDGDLETLLLKIVDSEKFGASYNCYEKYAKCSEVVSPKEYSDELLERKNKVFNYFRTYYGMEKAKEENRVFDPGYWNLSDDALNSFKLFINSLLKEI